MSFATRLSAAMMIICLGMPRLAHAGEREDTMLTLLDQVRTRERASSVAKLADLHNAYDLAKATEERRLTAFALGVHYLESSPRLALQYLSSAQQACVGGDPLLPMIMYYVADAKFRSGAYQEAAQAAKTLLTLDLGDTWTKKIHSLLIESLYALNDYAELTQAFKEFSKRYSFSRRQEVLGRMAAEAYAKRGEVAPAHELLEELARNYPATEESRWAFKKLEDATCLPDGRGRYYFSERLLHHLSRNVVLGTGIEEFLTAALDRPVVDAKGNIHRLAVSEKIDFLVRAHLFRRALNLVEGQVQQEAAKGDESSVPSLLFIIGRVHLRLFEPREGARYFAEFLTKYQRHPLVNRVREALGDALRYSGESLAAAPYYRDALVGHDTPLLRWMYFWSLLHGKDYKGALALVEKPGFVTPREGDDQVVVRYWHGRLLEVLGQQPAANDIYREILSTQAQSYYAAQIAARHPGLLPGPTLVPRDPASSQAARGAAVAAAAPAAPTSVAPVTVAAKTVPAPASLGFPTAVTLAAKTVPVPPSPDSLMAVALAAKPVPVPATPAEEAFLQRGDLKVISDLMRVGLNDAAAAKLGSLKWVGFNQADSFAAVTKLSASLDDYRPARNVRYAGFTSLRFLPRSWSELMSSQSEHNDEWKAYYPLAFDRLVVPYSAGLHVNPFFVLSIMRTESSYNKDARSGVGAQGLMQLMPYTALKIATLLHDEAFDVRDIAQPELNVAYGVYYLDRLLRYYGDNPVLAAAAYNGGPTVVNQWLGTCGGCSADEFIDAIPYQETRHYVREVMRTLDIYTRIYLGKSDALNVPPMPTSLPTGIEMF